MIRMFDGIYTLEIEGMYEYCGDSYEDKTEEVLVLDLKYLDWDPEHEAYLVDSCDSEAQQLEAWELGCGELEDEEESVDRYVKYCIRIENPVDVVKDCTWIKRNTHEKINPDRVWVEKEFDALHVFYRDEYDCTWDIFPNPWYGYTEVRWKEKNGAWTKWH